MAGEIVNPFKRGDRVVIPGGTVLRSTHPSKPDEYASRRTQTVEIHDGMNGYVELGRGYGHDPGFVNLPTIVWVGSGSYWVRAQLTQAVAEANGVSMPELPGQDGIVDGHYRLDVIPSYTAGYTDEWKVP